MLNTNHETPLNYIFISKIIHLIVLLADLKENLEKMSEYKTNKKNKNIYINSW